MKDRLDRLKNIKTESINSPKVEFSVASELLNFPLIVKSVNSELILSNWIKVNNDLFNEKLKIHGAILFRGFKINTVEKFQKLMEIFPDNPLEYKLRSSPRYALSKDVYVSTTYPEDQKINMHSESSYSPNHPMGIVFCCIIPPVIKGETPIADNRLLLKYISDETKQKFFNKEIKYKRNLTKKLGLAWQEVFQTSRKKDVEEVCKKDGINFNWKSDDELVLEWKKKAIWEHPTTGEMVWFNHALFFNKYSLEEGIQDSIISDDELPNNTFFGDDTEISRKEVEEIGLAYKKSTVEFTWEKGDVLFLDNMMISHGRNPFKGDRKIIVSILNSF